MLPDALCRVFQDRTVHAIERYYSIIAEAVLGVVEKCFKLLESGFKPCTKRMVHCSGRNNKKTVAQSHEMIDVVCSYHCTELRQFRQDVPPDIGFNLLSVQSVQFQDFDLLGVALGYISYISLWS